MSWASRFVARLRGVLEGAFEQSRLDGELDDEIRFHLDMQVEDNIRAGMAPAQARAAALRSFGAAEPMKERYRARRSFPFAENLIHDVRYALRSLRNNPIFTGAAVISLALGIGANTAIFTLIDAVMLRQLPVRNARELVRITVPQSDMGAGVAFPYPIVGALAEHRELFAALAGVATTEFHVEGVEVPGLWVTGRYYETLGVTPVAGRLLSPSDDLPGAPPAAVITDGYWARRYGRAPGAIGTRVRLGQTDAAIVGVSPPGFTGIVIGHAADITVAGAALPAIEGDLGRLKLGMNYWMLGVIARPRAGVPAAQLRAPLWALWSNLFERAPEKKFFRSGPEIQSAATGWSGLRQQFSRPLAVLMGVVALVLLIACANVANLSFARAGARQREIALRLAIGASRGRIAGQLLCESLLLSSAGAAIGIALASWGTRFIVDLISSGPAGRVALDLTLHWDILLFTTIAATGTALLFGLAPALRASRGASVLIRGAIETAARGRRLAPALVALQTALSLVLLIAAGLFLGTLRNLRRFDVGFAREGVLLAEQPGASFQTAAQGRALNRALLERIIRLPGVASASLSNSPIFSDSWINYGVSVVGHAEQPVDIPFHRIGPRYFETLRTPVIEGREFTLRDNPAAPPVAVINESFARRFLPEGHPIGRFLRIEGMSAPAEIAGLVKDVRAVSLREAAEPAVYVPFFQRKEGLTAVFTIRAAGSLAQVESELRGALRGSEPVEIKPLDASVERTLVQERLEATLATAFGALALTLASIGLYGVLAYTVARRTREIGIRMALGAARGSVLRMIMQEAALLLAAGIAIGLPAAGLAGRLVDSLLFGMHAGDPGTAAIAIAVLVASGMLAAVLPAIRAARVEPAVALRYE